MRAGSDEIEVRDDVIAIMDAEIGALREDRLKTERAALVRIEVLQKILRRIPEFGLDPILETGNLPRCGTGASA